MQSRRYICTGLMSLSASRGLRGRPGLVSSGLEAWHGDRRAEAGGAEGSRGAQVSGMEARSQWPGRFTRRKTLSQAAGLFVGPEGEPWEGGRGITVWEGAWWSGGEHSDGVGVFLEAGLVAVMTDHTRGAGSRLPRPPPGALHPASPLWQKVSRCSSPVSMLATHRSLLLMKEKKAGSAGQILGSIRGPEHWVLISRGFMGDTWGHTETQLRGSGGRHLPRLPPTRERGSP